MTPPAPRPSAGPRTPADPVEVARTLRLCNSSGLHARPCHAIAKTACEFESELTVSCGSVHVNGKSILELMTLCAPCQAELLFTAKGPDAEALMARLSELVDSGFHEAD